MGCVIGFVLLSCSDMKAHRAIDSGSAGDKSFLPHNGKVGGSNKDLVCELISYIFLTPIPEQPVPTLRRIHKY